MICSRWAWAQSPPNAGTLLQEQQKTQPNELQRKAPTQLQEEERPPLKETGVTFEIKGFHFTGNDGLIGEAELTDIVKDAIGEKMGLSGLKMLADRITRYLHTKGWFLARAYIPQQEIKDGSVEIAILAGRMEGAVEIRGKDLRINQDRLQKMAAAAVSEGEAIGARGMERALLLMNDLPGIQARSTLLPGKAPGTVGLAVDASEGPLVDGMIWGDNFGSRFTGATRGSGMLRINDPFHYGDQFQLNTTDNQNYKYGQAGYSFPLWYSGLRAGLSYSEMRYQIDRSLNPLDLEGGARVFGMTLNYPLKRSRTSNLWAGLEYDWKDLWDTAGNTKIDDKKINVGKVSLYGDMLDTFLGGGYTTSSIALTGGRLDRSGVADDLATDARTAETDGTYGKLAYGASRLQNLYEHLSLFLTVNGQVAFKNMDSSEQFILGGPYGVRAYPVSEASGDSGGTMTTEIRYDFPEIPYLGVPQLTGFYDLGWINLHESPWANSGTPIGDKNSYTLSGAGIGLNLLKAGLYAVRASWAAKIGDNPGRSLAGNDVDGRDDASRFWIQVLIRF